MGKAHLSPELEAQYNELVKLTNVKWHAIPVDEVLK
jgi:hypothetical protein